MYALITNGTVAEYPYNVGLFREAHPSISLPFSPSETQLEEVGIFTVVPVARPADSLGQVVEEGTPIFDNGKYNQVWNIRAATAPEVQSQLAAIQQAIVGAVQQRLDAFAQTRNYDSILSAATYVTSGVTQFQTEGQRAVDLRDQTWAALYQIMADVQAEERAVPTSYAEIEAELPVLTWTV